MVAEHDQVKLLELQEFPWLDLELLMAQSLSNC